MRVRRVLAAYQSLDYLPQDSRVYILVHVRLILSNCFLCRNDCDRWLVMGLIGLFVGLLGFFLTRRLDIAVILIALLTGTWFMAQTCTGVHALASYGWAESLRRHPEVGPGGPAHHRSVDTAVVYTGVAGLLNLLAILDALVRADLAPVRPRRAAAVAVRRTRT